jgi:hypothetical protein
LEYKHTDTVLRTIKERFPSGKVSEIFALPRLGYDGDPIVEVRVKVDTEIAKLDATELAFLAVHVRASMIEVGEEGFPILRILTKRDWADVQNESA